MIPRRPLIGIAAAVVLLAVGVAFAAGARSAGPTITVSPSPSRVDEPLNIRVTGLPTRDAIGLPKRQTIWLQLSSEDANGQRWKSEPVMRVAESDGTFLDVADKARDIPSKTFEGVCTLEGSMGLFETLRPHDGSDFLDEGSNKSYAWWKGKGQFFPVEDRSRTFTVRVAYTADMKNVVAEREFERAFMTSTETMKPVELETSNPAYPKTYGQFFQPSANAPRRAAALIFGGSEGGLTPKVVLAAQLVAARGYPTLALAYFQGESGVPQPYPDTLKLPPNLEKIPMETFRNALHWLSRQSSVKKDRIFVSGTSRGSEAALWLASHPDFTKAESPYGKDVSVYGVIANVPSSLLRSCFRRSEEKICETPAWTVAPEWTVANVLPFTMNQEKASGDAQLRFPFNKFSGPAFLDCGSADKVWDSCAFQAVLAEDLKARKDRYGIRVKNVEDYRCTGAGHGVGGLVAYSPSDPKPKTAAKPWTARGVDQFTNQRADADLWQRLLAFVKSYEN